MSSSQTIQLTLFTSGNQQTLKVDPERLGINVRDRIRAFFNEHYVAQHMTLAVMSNGQSKQRCRFKTAVAVIVLVEVF